MNELEILKELIKNIELYSPDYMKTAIAGLVTVNIELYTIKEAQRVIQEAADAAEIHYGD